MSITTELKEGILYANFSDELNLQQALHHLNFLEELSNEAETIRELMDFTNCNQISISSDELRSSAFAGRSLSESTKYYLAICAPTELHFGLSRMFQIFHELAENQFVIQVFRDRTSAEDWLKSLNQPA